MKKTLMVFVILGAVLAVLLTVRSCQRQAMERREAAEVSLAKMSFSFDPMTVTDCTVTSPTEKVTLKKEKGIWRIVDRFGGMQADAAVFLDFLVSLKKINTEERSNDPALFKEYGLTDKEAIRIELKSEGKLLEDLLLGVKATDQRSNFIRRKDSSKVYAVTEDILTYMGFGQGEKERKLNIDKWADKRVVTFDPAMVTGLTIREGKTIYADLSRDDEKSPWKFRSSYPYLPDSEKIKNYLQMLGTLRGFSVADAAEAAFSAKDWTEVLTMKDGTTVALSRKAAADGTFYVRTADRGYAVKLAVYHFDNLTKSDGAFFGDNIFAIDEAKVSEVRFQDVFGKKKEVLTKKTEGTGDAAKTIWIAGRDRSFSADKVKELINAVKELRLETSSSVVRKGSEVLSVSLTLDKLVRAIRIWDRPSSGEGSSCFPLQIDRSAQLYCVQESSLRSLVNVLANLYQPPAK